MANNSEDELMSWWWDYLWEISVFKSYFKYV